MKFEWDERKNEKNIKKHGISFQKASRLFLLESAVHVPAKIIGDEYRFALIADDNGKLWTVIYVNRGENYRIISARRANGKEEKQYKTYHG